MDVLPYIAKSSDENMAYVLSITESSHLFWPFLTHALHYNAISLIFIFSFLVLIFFKRVLQLNRMSNKTDIIDV